MAPPLASSDRAPTGNSLTALDLRSERAGLRLDESRADTGPGDLGHDARQSGCAWDSLEDRLVSLSDGDVAALARRAVDRIDPDLDVSIEPADPVDPYRRETAAWTVRAGSARSYIVASMTEDQALGKLTADLAG